MFPAPAGLAARYRYDGTDDESAPQQDWQLRAVIAFTDEGEPMIIGDAEDLNNHRLIRADTYSNYDGITHSETFWSVGKLALLPTSDRRTGDQQRSSTEQHDVNGQIDDQTIEFSLTALEFAAIEIPTMRALELAGKRLLNNGNRSWRGQLRRVPPWEIHAQIPVNDPDEALAGAYALLHKCLPGQRHLHQVIDSYVRERLATQTLHDRNRLLTMLIDAGWRPDRRAT